MEKYIIKAVDLSDDKKLPGECDYRNNLYNSYEEANKRRESYIAQNAKKGRDVTYAIFKLVDIRALKVAVETEEVKFEKEK